MKLISLIGAVLLGLSSNIQAACDQIQSLVNDTGALNISGYKFGSQFGVSDSYFEAMIASGSPSCPNSISITTQATQSSSSGDGIAKRKFNSLDKQSTRFSVRPPVPTVAAPVVGSLVFRDIEFRAAQSSGRLRFELINAGDGAPWSINAKMEYSNGVVIHMGNFQLKSDQDPKFDVLFEYTFDTPSPRLKLTYFLQNGSTIEASSDLYSGLRPVIQRVGLLSSSLTPNRTFAVRNCDLVSTPGACSSN